MAYSGKIGAERLLEAWFPASRVSSSIKIPYAMRGIPQLHREDLEEFRTIIAEKGIDCFF
jgi:hypothetical protein